MTLDQDEAEAVVERFRQRGITLLVNDDGDLELIAGHGPKGAVTKRDQAQIRKHGVSLYAALTLGTPTPVPEPKRAKAAKTVTFELTVDEILRVEDERRRMTEMLLAAQPPVQFVMFKTARGLLELAELNVDEVRDLESRGKLSKAEVKEWARERDPSRRRGYGLVLKGELFF